MFSKCIAKLFALEPAATAVEASVIAAILLTGLCCLLLATGDSVASLYHSVLGDLTTASR